MRKEYKFDEKYLYIPVQPGLEDKLVEFFVEKEGIEEKILEFVMPIDQHVHEAYDSLFQAKIPLEGFEGEKLIVEAEASESFFDAVEVAGNRTFPTGKKPVIHMAPDVAWCNDPNGLVYHDGVYHFYYQYNPVDIKWNNMCWAHATSTDLLHWKQEDIVLLPEENGVMYSGCGLVNDKKMLDLPEDALLFVYTMAGGINQWSRGKEFTQNVAYSLDGGKHLTKIEGPVIDTISYENRDPKVFWHEESQAYITPLWIKGCEYGIFRSTDLKHWERTQQLFFEHTWECPDLICLTSDEGEKCWFFLTADGFYYPGDFDGYEFKEYGERHKGNITPLPYAAQTYSNTGDRTISIPWLRVRGDGRPFVGTYGIPVEFTYQKRDGKHFILQKPVRELFEQAKPIEVEEENGKYRYTFTDKALLVKMELNEDVNLAEWNIKKDIFLYKRRSGVISGEGQYFMAGEEYKNIMMLIDDMILEIFFENGENLATFQINAKENGFVFDKNMVKYCEFFEIE